MPRCKPSELQRIYPGPQGWVSQRDTHLLSNWQPELFLAASVPASSDQPRPFRDQHCPVPSPNGSEGATDSHVTQTQPEQLVQNPVTQNYVTQSGSIRAHEHLSQVVVETPGEKGSFHWQDESLGPRGAIF